jgi:hypothetical protein
MKERGKKTMKITQKARKGMASLEAVLVVGISLPMAAWVLRFLSKLMESLFYMIGTVVGSAYL